MADQIRWTKHYDDSIAGGQPGHTFYTADTPEGASWWASSDEHGGWLLSRMTPNGREDTMTLPTLRDCKAHVLSTLERKKTCPRCGVTKVRATDFTHRSDGTVFSWCKACNVDYRRERAAAKREAKAS